MRLPGLNKSADRLWIMTAGCSLLEGEVTSQEGTGHKERCDAGLESEVSV